MSPPPQNTTMPPQQDANVRRVQPKWQPATAETLRHGQPQTPQYNPANRDVEPIAPAAAAPLGTTQYGAAAPTTTGGQYVADPGTHNTHFVAANAAGADAASLNTAPVASQSNAPTNSSRFAAVPTPATTKDTAPTLQRHQQAEQQQRAMAPIAPVAMKKRNNAFGGDKTETRVVRQETTRQYYGAVPPVVPPVAPAAAPMPNMTQNTPVANSSATPSVAAVPVGPVPKIASRKLSGFEELFVKGNVRSIAAITFGNLPRERSKVTSALTAALLAHPIGYTTIENGNTIAWQRQVDNDGNVSELPHTRFDEEVISAAPQDLANAAIARELAEPRGASGTIGITLLLKERNAQAPIDAQTHTASRFDHPRTMIGDEYATGQPTHVAHDYGYPGQAGPANDRMYTTQYETQPAAAGTAAMPYQQQQHSALFANNAAMGAEQRAEQQHTSLYPNNGQDGMQTGSRLGGGQQFQPQTREGFERQLAGANSTQSLEAGRGDNILGVVFNSPHALMDAVVLKQLVQYFISLVTQSDSSIAGSRAMAPPDVVMEPAAPLNRDTIPGLRGKHIPTHYLPLDPKARKGRHGDLSSESSLSSEDIQRDFGMYRRLSKQEVKQLKKLEKREEKFAKEEDEHRYQIEKAEYKELKGISKVEYREFKRIDKLERKEHKVEDKEMKERAKIEYKEAKDQQTLAKKALKHRIPGIMVFDYRERRSTLVDDRVANGPQPLTEDLQRHDSRHVGGIYFLTTADVCGFADGTDPKLMVTHTKDSMAHENRDLSEANVFIPDVHALLERQTLDALRSKSTIVINNTSLLAAAFAVASVARAHARGSLVQHLASYDRVGVTISIPVDLRDRSIVNEPEFMMPGAYVDANMPARRLNFLNCFGTITVGVEFDGHLFRGCTADEFLKRYDVVSLASTILLDVQERIARGEAHKDALAISAGQWSDVAPTGTVELCMHGLYRDAQYAEVTLSTTADPRVFADNKALSIAAWSSATHGTTSLAASMCGAIDRREVNSLMYSAMASLAHASLF